MTKIAPILSLLLALSVVAPATAHPLHDDEASNQQSEAKPEQRRRHSPGKNQEPHSPATAYKDEKVLGWSLLVHEDLIADQELYKEVRDEIHHQLFRITRIVPEEKVKLLQQVPIWVELRNPYSRNCQYHPSKRWLVANGYLAEKANCVELSDARRFVRTSQKIQPYVLLHELAHAYHDLHLDFGHEGIVAAFKKAKESGSYDKVLHIIGRTVRAYAMTDHKEYFAEATEAFFGTNDHYPFVRSELKEHDPGMYEMVKQVWGVE